MPGLHGGVLLTREGRSGHFKCRGRDRVAASNAHAPSAVSPTWSSDSKPIVRSVEMPE